MMKSQPTLLSPLSPSADRRGVMLILAAAAIVLLLAVAAISVDVSFMQLTRTELRAAADAASKAGVEALQRTQDTDEAIQAAIDIAQKNRVAGRPLKLTDEDIEIGSSRMLADGSWEFVPDATPYNSVRVHAEMSSNNSNGAVPLFLAGMFGRDSFTPEKTSTAANMEQEIYLVVDRSHSMCFDLSGVDWKYPPGTKTKPNAICYPPHPSLSRWAVLVESVEEFLAVSERSSPKPRVGIITWGSDIGTSTVEYLLTHLTASAVNLDSLFTTDFKSLLTALSVHSNQPMLGGTNMSAGMLAGIDELRNGRPLTQKVMILMTDGQWNAGTDPVGVASIAKQYGIVIHTVTFLPGAEQTTMQQVATVTGGRHYHADDADQLKAAFEELARTLPVVLTK